MKYELSGVIQKITPLHAIINAVPAKIKVKDTADVGGSIKIKLYGAIGDAKAFTDEMVLQDVDGLVLMDVNNEILKVTEGSATWPITTEN